MEFRQSSGDGIPAGLIFPVVLRQIAAVFGTLQQKCRKKAQNNHADRGGDGGDFQHQIPEHLVKGIVCGIVNPGFVELPVQLPQRFVGGPAGQGRAEIRFKLAHKTVLFQCRDIQGDGGAEGEHGGVFVAVDGKHAGAGGGIDIAPGVGDEIKSDGVALFHVVLLKILKKREIAGGGEGHRAGKSGHRQVVAILAEALEHRLGPVEVQVFIGGVVVKIGVDLLGFQGEADEAAHQRQNYNQKGQREGVNAAFHDHTSIAKLIITFVIPIIAS